MSTSTISSMARGACIAQLERLGMPHVYEEFPDNHSGVDYRMDMSLPFLAKALSE